MALKGRNAQWKRSPMISDGQYDAPRSISDDKNLTSTDIAASATSESTFRRLHVSTGDGCQPRMGNPGGYWRAYRWCAALLGRVCPTLMPQDSMRHATELVAEFEAPQARIRARRGVKAERKGKPDASSGRLDKKRLQGRPRSYLVSIAGWSDSESALDYIQSC